MGKLKYKLVSPLYSILLSITFTQCIENNTQPPLSLSLDNSAKIISYVESEGDYPNLQDAPYLVSAADLYYYTDQYLKIDVRDEVDYLIGHIENSINVNHVNLYSIIDSIRSGDPITKIVLICKDGQQSTYYASLLNIAGFKNIYSLKYGLSSWNIDFAGIWLSTLGNVTNLSDYTNESYSKPFPSALPTLTIPNKLKSGEEITKYRVKELVKQGFLLNINYVENLSTENRSPSFDVCYGVDKLYYASPHQGGPGHLPGVVWFSSYPDYEFRSTKYLQCLPNNNSIVIYSTNGHQSACITAYLNVLGYDAKTMLYGANQLFYYRLIADSLLFSEETFSNSVIMNFSYVSD